MTCRKSNNTMERILKLLSAKLRVLQKPNILPISTEEEMVAFENTNEDTFEEVVSILFS